MKVNDSNIYYPEAFAPYSKGEEFEDLSFGTKIKRITNAVITRNEADTGTLPFIMPEYAATCPFSVDDAFFMLLHTSYYGLYDSKGTFIKSLPLRIKSGTEPRWTNDKNLITFLEGNKICYYNIKEDKFYDYWIFKEYNTITMKGEQDYPANYQHVALLGDNRDIFSFDMGKQSKGRIFNTSNVDNKFDNLRVLSDGSVIVGWYTKVRGGDGSVNTGYELYDRNMNPLRQLAQAIGHADIMRIGAADAMLWCSSDESKAGKNSAILINPLTGTRDEVLNFDWFLAMHISGSDSSSAFISTYQNTYVKSNWRLYADEIIRVNVMTKEVQRLAHHRSKPFDEYNWQSRASSNRAGTKCLFSSNFGLRPNTNYTDTYMIDLTSSEVKDNPNPAPPIEISIRTKIASLSKDKKYSFVITTEGFDIFEE